MDYYQCKMEKIWSDKKSVQTAWIPGGFAKVGGYVNLRDAKGHWEDGWMVIEVGHIAASWDEVNERGRDYLKQREASDI